MFSGNEQLTNSNDWDISVCVVSNKTDLELPYTLKNPNTVFNVTMH